MNGLVIFVDSLRFDAPMSAGLERSGLTRLRYVPPLGYSANILPLLYRGKTPDELGFYNEYGVGARDRAGVLAIFDPYVETIGRIPILRKVIYRTLRTAGVDAANIPMRLLPYFSQHSSSTYATGLEHPSLFEAADFRLVLANQVRRSPPERDRIALEEAVRAIERHSCVYLSLNDLDSVSHEWGLESPEYARHEQLLGEGVGELIARFRQLRGEDAPVVVLSDHGMATVSATVNLQVEERLGRPGRDRYLYFLDSTLLRVWCYDPALRPEVERMLAESAGLGRRVTDEERQCWGIASPASGDYLFVLDEGLIFEPNFIGRGVPKAMHGYHPDYASQHAVFLTNRPEVVARTELSGADPYHALRTLFVADGCTSVT